MQYLTIDRIEGGFAVCETESRTFINVLLSGLPSGAKEGCVLKEENGKYILDENETARRRQINIDLQNSIW